MRVSHVLHVHGLDGTLTLRLQLNSRQHQATLFHRKMRDAPASRCPRLYVRSSCKQARHAHYPSILLLFRDILSSRGRFSSLFFFLFLASRVVSRLQVLADVASGNTTERLPLTLKVSPGAFFSPSAPSADFLISAAGLFLGV